MFIWVEACNITMYIHNRSPHRILGDKTLEEAFIGVKLEIGNFRIFGCLVYIHVTMEKRTKLECLGQKDVLVGYNETSKAYRIFIPAQMKTVVSRDVKFDEHLTSRKSHEPLPLIEDEEQKASNDEQRSTISSLGSQPSGGEESLAPPSSVRRPR
jgi:hypothetical protein